MEICRKTRDAGETGSREGREMDSLIVGKLNCTLGGKTFPHGAELCSAGVCKLCDDGRFQVPPELSLGGDEVMADPGEAYFVPGS